MWCYTIKCNNNLDKFNSQYAIAPVRNETPLLNCNKRIGGIIPRLSSKRVYFTRQRLSRIRAGFRNPGSGFLRRFQFIRTSTKSLLSRLNVQARSNICKACLGSKDFRQSDKSVQLTRKILPTKSHVSREDSLHVNTCLRHPSWHVADLWHWYLNISNAEDAREISFDANISVYLWKC